MLIAAVTFASLWIVVASALAVAGLALTVWALVGDRAKGRRRCPRCWYDMGSTDGLRCPECGREARSERDLARPRRRTGFAALGLIVLLAGTIGAVWPSARAYDWNRAKPVWWLLRDAQAMTPGGDAAIEELVRRVRAETLSQERIDEFVDLVLAAQTDPNASWDDATPGMRRNRDWAEIVAAARDLGRVDTARQKAFLRNAFDETFTMQARASVGAGAPVPVRWRARWPRIPHSWSGPSTLLYTHQGQLKRVTVDGAEVPIPAWLRRVQQFNAANLAGGSSEPTLEVDLEPGVHTFRFEWDFAVRRAAFRAPLNGTDDQVAGLDEVTELHVRWERAIECHFEVVEGSSVTLVPDESMRETIEQAIVRANFAERQFEAPSGTRYGSMWGMILFDDVPVNLSFDVFGRGADGVEKQFGAIVVPANEGRITNAQQITEDPKALFPGATTIDVILRASPDAAERTVDVTEVWDGAIVIEDVPIR